MSRLRDVLDRARQRVERPAGPAEGGSSGGHEAAVACKAPFSSMYLDQRGNVRACCMNDLHVLGNITDTPLLDIWNGARTAELRRAVASQDLSLGCDFCEWRVERGRPDLAHLRWFEQFDVDAPEPEWPQQLEFSISNTCNLQCAMCNGEWSSSIRSQREGLPPLPKVYGDHFFEDLRAFLPHLRSAKFLGGEPFLAGETLRIMELMIETGSRARCHVTTNGTLWSPRVERILDLVPLDIAVSLDAATPETYHQIRIGADWDLVQANLDRFQARAEQRGIDVTLTFCLMRTNVHELLDFCRLADRRGVGCTVNTVTSPSSVSLYHLSVDELAEVVETLERQHEHEAATLGRSRATWDGELERLRSHLEDRRGGRQVVGIDIRKVVPKMVEDLRDQAEPLLLETVGRGAARLELGTDDIIAAVEPDEPVLGVATSDLVGRPSSALAELFEPKLGRLEDIDINDRGQGIRVISTTFAGGATLALLSLPAVLSDGRSLGTWLYVGVPTAG